MERNLRFLSLEPFLPFGAHAMSRERVSSAGPTVLSGAIQSPVRFACTFSGSFANLNGQLFTEGAESRLQLVEPEVVPEIEQAIDLGQVTVEPPG